MAPKPPITDEEFDLLDRAIYRYAVDPRGLSLEGSDRDTARRLEELNYVTIRGGRLSRDGGTEAGAGVYLGLSGVQWRRHAQAADGRPGPWAMHVLRMLPAHPRVVTWVLEYEEPLGRAVVTEFLEHLGRHGLAQKHGADWRRTAAGERAIAAEETIDPYELWIARHRDELDRLDNAGADFLASLRRQLRERARDAGRSWPTKETVRSRHLSSVLRQATQRSLSHGCELAHALWSRTVLDLTKGVS